MPDNENASSILGTEIKIIRERFFINHLSIDSKKLKREFTLVPKTEDKVDSIFIKIPELLPNLKIFDSDGTILPLITNKYTIALIERTIDKSKDQNEIASLRSLLQDIKEHKTYLLWIKLQHEKKIHPNDSRVIIMEYDAKKEESVSFVPEFLSASDHEVFYIISPPKDYEFDKKKITINNISGEEFKKKYSKGLKNEKGDVIYYDEYSDSITIRINPESQSMISMKYSFTPTKKTRSFVKGILGLLMVAPIITMLSKYCFPMSERCLWVPSIFDLDLIYTKIFEIDVAIIGTVLVIAGLIYNFDVRQKFKWWFFAPVFLAVLAIILKL